MSVQSFWRRQQLQLKACEQGGSQGQNSALQTPSSALTPVPDTAEHTHTHSLLAAAAAGRQQLPSSAVSTPWPIFIEKNGYRADSPLQSSSPSAGAQRYKAAGRALAPSDRLGFTAAGHLPAGSPRGAGGPRPASKEAMKGEPRVFFPGVTRVVPQGSYSLSLISEARQTNSTKNPTGEAKAKCYCTASCNESFFSKLLKTCRQIGQPSVLKY